MNTQTGKTCCHLCALYLHNGMQGVCENKDCKCHQVNIQAGEWKKEVSSEIKNVFRRHMERVRLEEIIVQHTDIQEAYNRGKQDLLLALEEKLPKERFEHEGTTSENWAGQKIGHNDCLKEIHQILSELKDKLTPKQ